MSPLVIRSTRVMAPDGIRPATLHLEHARIARVGSYAEPPADAELHDVGDSVVMPGLVDTHVHLNDPGRADWEGFDTGTAAAAAGGVTTIVDMPLNSIPATTTVDALEQKRAAARGRMYVDVAFWGGVVPWNRESVSALCDAGVRGFKCFLVPSGVDEFAPVSLDDLRHVLATLAKRGLPLLVHAELPTRLESISEAAPRSSYSTWLASRPSAAEIDAITILIDLCREFRTRLHIVHLSAAAAVPVLRTARDEGLPISVETCPHYLTFCAEEIPDGDTSFKCAPPIRDRYNRDALWQALEEGVIDFVATDHSPSPPALKCPGDFVQAWGGIASLGLSLPVLWTGAVNRHISLERIPQWLCAGPAKLAGLEQRKGMLRAGMDADVVVWDPDAEFVVHPERLQQRHKQTPYSRRRLRGRVRKTYVRGRLVYRDGTVIGPPRGELIARS